MYTITVTKITQTEYQETDTRYVNKKTREECRYSDNDAVSERYETGKKLLREDKQEVFTQRLDEMDVGKLAVFLNQK